ncbi:hypothetical protein BO71DRAFT_320467 [Aspergillus ellipticus CBS 707.79]|uniref:CFEM domain-containing protein n=1 Tax=Aspergillus ellipticus CBS 707.79 TaxID=1448320 RepID=A0A319E7B3_9EURO|nr:hypothetical protein BO71DRAFT_320467 [Aspergillus ellipticus CBS 707.79]
MQLSHAFAILLASTFANAQIPSVPPCSVNCFVTAFQVDGCSQLTDFACHCQKPELVKVVTPCVQSSCNLEDQSAVSTQVIHECSLLGHPISIPPVGSGLDTTSLSLSASRTSATDTGVVSSSPSTPASSGSVTLPTVSSTSTASSSKASSSVFPTGSSAHGSSAGAHSSTSSRSSSSQTSPAPLATGSASSVEAGMFGAALVAILAVCML